jgi:hypothetical protein
MRNNRNKLLDKMSKLAVQKIPWVWHLLFTNLDLKPEFKEARYSYLKNREQNRVTIFTRRSRKLINKMKELPEWPDVSSCSRHITPSRVF